MRAGVLAFVWLGVGVLGGCGGGEESAPASSPRAAATSPAAAPARPAEAVGAATAEAEQIFSTRCVTCHGPQGAGDGPGSAGLDPKPRNFQDPAWQSSVSDEHLGKVILYGGAAVGKSPAMPANPDLVAKPQVAAALVEHLRSLAQD
jgi:mono/diheme cytochrome c family protein